MCKREKDSSDDPSDNKNGTVHLHLTFQINSIWNCNKKNKSCMIESIYKHE